MNLKELFSAHDMTVGAPWKRIMEFTVPMLIGNLAQQLYNTADSIVVGHYIGDNALAAVGSAGPILNLLLALFVGVATGAGIVISQNYGAGRRDKLSESVGNCITLAAIASAVTTVIGLLLTTPMLRMLDTPESILSWSAGYLHIIFWGVAGGAFYNILSGILRGLGDSVSALLFLLVATGLNIALDIWFVAGFRMGVAGVALATVLAQGISAVLCLLKLLRMQDVFDLTWDSLRLRRDSALRIVRIGVPSGITQAIMSVAMLVVQSLTNSMGEAVIACNVIIMRVDGFAMMPNMSFGQAMSVYAGQNVGAGKVDRVLQGRRQGMVRIRILPVVNSVNNVHRHRGTDRAGLPDDEHHGRRIHCRRRFAGAGRHHAGRGGHGDAHVDLHDYHHRPAGAYGVHPGVVYPLRGVAKRPSGSAVLLTAGLMGAGCGVLCYRLPEGQMAAVCD